MAGGAHLLIHDGERFPLDPDSGRLLGPDGVKDKDAVLFDLRGWQGCTRPSHPPRHATCGLRQPHHLWNADAHYWDAHLATLDQHTIVRPSLGALGIGAGAPPVQCEEGLLMFFHERRADGVYTMNLALLDAHTGRPIDVHGDALMVPELEWEVFGDVDNVIFVQGAHVADDGDTITLVYGAADRHVGRPGRRYVICSSSCEATARPMRLPAPRRHERAGSASVRQDVEL